jgi:hypothetical protein
MTRSLFTFAIAGLLAVRSTEAAVAVLTMHNNLARTGANLEETILSTRNVNTNEFGLLYSRPVDDQIYAQPLVMTNVDLGSRGRHNLLIVATVNNSVYAFDADNATVSAPYWQVSLLGPDAVAPTAADMTGACGGEYVDFSGKLGLVCTPVIDPTTGTMYVLARTKEKGSRFAQYLHALDVRTGAERPNSPVFITATYSGHGDGNSGGVITFDPWRQGPRPGLALVNGIVYAGWASHCDWGPYHGWLLGYEAGTLKQAVVFNTTPEGGAGGIWMSGQAPAADKEGNLFITIGNGTVGRDGHPEDVINRGESILKLTRDAGSMRVSSWFTPHNWLDLEHTDNDFGSSGPMLIAGTKLAISGSKEGRIYLVNRDQMGNLSASRSDTNAAQSFAVTRPGSSAGLFGAAVCWEGPESTSVYFWCKEDNLRQYRLDSAAGKLVLPEMAQGPKPFPVPMPGGILSISANGKRAGSGILWATHAVRGNGNHEVCPGILRAYDAENVAHELWNSSQLDARDNAGNFAKFVPPTVANGKVYLATFSNRLNVYGLLSAR